MALSWLTRAHPQQHGQAILDARISRHSSRSLSRAGEQVSYALNHWLPPSHWLQIGELQATTTHAQPSYLAHALCAAKHFHKQVVFGHRVILIFSGDQGVAEGF